MTEPSIPAGSVVTWVGGCRPLGHLDRTPLITLTRWSRDHSSETLSFRRVRKGVGDLPGIGTLDTPAM
jgi:hypothetical protein